MDRYYYSDMIYGKSLLYKDDEKVEEIKRINNNLTIMYFLENEKSRQSMENMSNILKKVSERKTQSMVPSSPSTESSLPS